MGAFTTAALVATAAYSAYSSVKGGKQQASSLTQQGEFNAQVYEQQAAMIQEQKKLKDYQYNRAAVKQRGAIISHTAGAGLNLSGSPMAMLIDSETQLLMDKATENYNLDVQRNYALSGATASRADAYQKARLAKATGYSNAFTTLLSAGTNIGMLNMSGARKP